MKILIPTLLLLAAVATGCSHKDGMMMDDGMAAKPMMEDTMAGQPMMDGGMTGQPMMDDK